MPGNDSTNHSTEPSLKLKTARTLKWNSIDRISSQLIYAVTGIVLANVLTQEEFGLVGVIYVFQAFAILFVDSGFGAALLQRKTPADEDYSTVFWFNLAVSCLVYAILWAVAPGIASMFHDVRLTALSRVMFLSFIINGLGIVQTNRLMKLMNVRMIAVSNLAGLVISGVIGIWLALSGYGAWAIVWQTIALGTVKTAILWGTGGWWPTAGFHLASLKKIYRVGMGVFASSFLNTLFLQIYSFVIGRWNLAALGVYTQADKWSKMGSASLSQILTASFVPLLARVQENRAEFHRMVRKINAFTGFILFPFMGGLTVMAGPIFHLFFGHKWDAAIVLFQILILRGIFVVLTSLYNNYLLSLGHARSLFIAELVKDGLTIAAIGLTWSFGSVEALVWGQLGAGIATYVFTLWLTCRNTGYGALRMLTDLIPYAALTAGAMLCMGGFSLLTENPPLLIATESIAGLGIYIGVLKISGAKILDEATGYLFGRFRKKTQMPH